MVWICKFCIDWDIKGMGLRFVRRSGCLKMIKSVAGRAAVDACAYVYQWLGWGLGCVCVFVESRRCLPIARGKGV